MTYREIFDDVVDIMKHDSATCIDIEGADPVPFREEIREDMTDKNFAALVNKYLYSFGLTGHLWFYEHNPMKPQPEPSNFFPFLVKRGGDRLYVVYAHKDSGWSKGDIITELDGMTIPDAEKKYYWLIDEKDPERQRYEWIGVINTYIRNLRVIRKNTGVTEEAEYRRMTEPDERMNENSKFFFKKLSDDTAIIRLPDFMHKEPIDKIFSEFKEFIRIDGKNVIFDVRENRGGNDSFFSDFMPYLFPEGKNTYNGKNMACQKLYTERNCRNSAQTAEALDYPKEEKEKDIKDIMKMSGKGWSPVYSENEDFSFTITGRKKPENVYILTDEHCGSSGDSFVEIFSMSDKVTVIGRPTMGINDYSCGCIAQYGEMAFMYPMSRNIYINDGIRLMGKGLPVDVYVPWTPEHIERDVMLEKALEIIEQKKEIR